MDSGYFHPFLDSLNELCRTHFIDLRGGSIEEYIRQVSEVCATAAASRTILLGHSFGAAVVIECIAAHPAMAAQMILVAPMYDASWLLQFKRDFGARYAVVARQIEGMRLDRDAAYRESTKALVDLYFDQAHIADGIRVLSAIKYDGAEYDRLSSYVEALDLKDKLRRIVIPSLFIAGQSDQIIRASYISAGASLVAGSRLCVVPQAGHFPFVEQSDAVRRLIADFVSDFAAGQRERP